MDFFTVSLGTQGSLRHRTQLFERLAGKKKVFSPFSITGFFFMTTLSHQALAVYPHPNCLCGQWWY